MTDTSRRSADQPSVAELIELGRDREAVEVAQRAAQQQPKQVQPDDGGQPMDGVQQLDEILPMLEELVLQLQPDQLDEPTPCAAFSVTGVLEHMIGGASMFAPAFRGEAPSEVGGAPADGTVTERWGRAMADLADAIHAPGAQERTIASPFGEVPGAMFARYVAFDGLVHGWDIATASGLTYSPRSEIVAEVDAFARNLLQPQMRDGDTFAVETESAPTASDLERLVAFSGRHVPVQEAAR